ncbi:hypothetical protein DY78_GL002036 [Lactiplantibacillus fabifermentans DSM 21115]|uniref:Uncharacterized protein n=1 Tax=Lactiplantibacillus fabifermentans DSM 21115 TaxID=1413187 RepID=A0A0R2N9N5_9LACO|nr:hypothetical protein DY78_GL002036 [Lactiplantibacillus fabifermentans DSM 21115]
MGFYGKSTKKAQHITAISREALCLIINQFSCGSVVMEAAVQVALARRSLSRLHHRHL